VRYEDDTQRKDIWPHELNLSSQQGLLSRGCPEDFVIFRGKNDGARLRLSSLPPGISQQGHKDKYASLIPHVSEVSLEPDLGNLNALRLNSFLIAY
jgi:hypothetical protein